ncbi:MAG: prepilin-type N-terminal cleavage/methylation domain-containing protein [Candidatus Omnitrophica bacterium]|nr:prepilin-type N-terminal cleavage/methylation domain-containing protein [Candidatus Omnitrophota bacterium]
MKGFTLLEVLVSILILSLLFAGISSVLVIGNTVFHSDLGILDLEQQVRQAMEAMLWELREASNVTMQSSDSISFNSFSGVNISYVYNDGNNDGIKDQILRQESGATRILAQDISYLLFSVSGNLVTIEVSGGKNILGKQSCFPSPCQSPLKTFNGQVRLRN